MGLLIVAVGDEGKADGFLIEGDGPFPAESPVSLEDLERLYPAAAAMAKEDAGFRDRARKATAELQADVLATAPSGPISSLSAARRWNASSARSASPSTCGTAKATPIWSWRR
jgi:hypothetical protein